jgi:cysteine desulfurase family protein
MLKGVAYLERIAYFDNAATTFPKPEEVYTFMDTFYRECGVNVGRGQHKLAARAAALVAETRSLLLDLNHCPNKTVIFTPSATEALNLILRSLICKGNLNIYISPFEHNAVIRVINYAAQAFKFGISTLAFDKETYKYDIEQIKYQFIENRPDIVILSHASNVCGVIAPIVEICTLSKKYGAMNVVDMCQTMGLIDTDLSNDNIDYAVFAAHKTLYGPQGIGGLIMNPDTHLEPLIYGGTGTDSANPLLPDILPDRYEAGSPNIQAIAGLNASLKWIHRVGINTIFEKENENHRRLLDLLMQYDNIKIVSPIDAGLGIGVVSAVFDGYSSDNIGQILSERDIAIRSGLHCAPGAHRFLGTFPAGTARFSVGYFNTDDEFAQLKDTLDYICENS